LPSVARVPFDASSSRINVFGNTLIVHFMLLHASRGDDGWMARTIESFVHAAYLYAARASERDCGLRSVLIP
jgi:hypothetical protein